MADDLSTAQLAERAGLRAATLRMWESRHGFPRSVSERGVRRRYTEQEAEAVAEVVRLRALGLSLPAAIARTRAVGDSAPRSIFAALRERRPELQPIVLEQRPLLSLTRAIEDEFLARGGAGRLIASFQREELYRRSERRWRELARSAELAVVLADFASVRGHAPGPIEVPVPREHPLSREWTLAVAAPEMMACIAAWEQPQADAVPEERRRFETLWSFEPDVVVEASAVASAFAAGAAPALAAELVAGDGPLPIAGPSELRVASALSHRLVAYLVQSRYS